MIALQPLTQKQIEVVDQECDRRSAASKAKVNKQRRWYRMISKSAGLCWGAISAELEKATDAQLIAAYREIGNVEPLNSWFFLVKMKDPIATVIYNELVDRGFENVWRDQQATREWKRREIR